jgi:hypothetical protein
MRFDGGNCPLLESCPIYSVASKSLHRYEWPAKATGRHSFDVGLRDLETPLTKQGLLQAGETDRYRSAKTQTSTVQTLDSAVPCELVSVL